MEQAIKLRDHPAVVQLSGRYTSYADNGQIGIATTFEDELYVWVPPKTGFESSAASSPAAAEYGLRVVRFKVCDPPQRQVLAGSLIAQSFSLSNISQFLL